jgi:hypothetical protein
MKFEKPVAVVEKFDLADILTASGEVTPTTTKKSQPNTIVGEDGGVCAYNKTDNYNFDNCL